MQRNLGEPWDIIASCELSLFVDQVFIQEQMKDKSGKNANSSEIIWHLHNNEKQIFNTF
jgi:hypothetical protein